MRVKSKKGGQLQSVGTGPRRGRASKPEPKCALKAKKKAAA